MSDFIGKVLAGAVIWALYCAVFKILTSLMGLEFNLALITYFWIIIHFLGFICAGFNKNKTKDNNKRSKNGK